MTSNRENEMKEEEAEAVEEELKKWQIARLLMT